MRLFSFIFLFEVFIRHDSNITFALKLFRAQIAADDVAVLNFSVATQCRAARRIGSYGHVGSFDGVDRGIAFGADDIIFLITIEEYNIIFADDTLQFNAIGECDL